RTQFARTIGYGPGAGVITLRSTGATLPYGSQFSIGATTYTILVAVGPVAAAVPITPVLQDELITQVELIRGEDSVELQYPTPPTIYVYETLSANTYSVTDARIQQLALSIMVRPQEAPAPDGRFSIRARQVSGFGDEKYNYGDMML